MGAVSTNLMSPFTQDLGHTTVTFDMVPVPGGTVIIDQGETVREVEVDPFWICPTELTWEVYDVFMLRLDRHRSPEGTAADAVTRPSKPYLPPDRGFGHAGYPAISMTYHAAKTFCQWLSLKTGRHYRLPTEAEWIHACALGEIDGDNIDDYAWHDGNSDYQTQKAASKKPSAVGLYDMHGNALEWCTDLDGKPVTLGGSYIDLPEDLGCAFRKYQDDTWNVSDPQIPKSRWWLADGPFAGFRIVCVPDETMEGADDEQP
jgi:formylglycine-generating enzyme required for sulfatase activity